MIPAENISCEPLGTDADGILRYAIHSPYQAAPTTLRVMAPPGQTPRRQVFFLPVQPGETGQWGDPFQVVQSGSLHTRHQILAICPSFSDWPWYADHPTDRGLRQESHFLQGILPLVDQLYPVDQPIRILLGFSKSGYGAFSLLLRHPALFACAGAWDAPLMKSKPDQFEMPQIFGTQPNFERYRFSNLLGENGLQFKDSPRLVLAGYDNFKDHVETAHRLLLDEQVPHIYRNDVRHPHRWEGGWLEWLLSELLKLI